MDGHTHNNNDHAREEHVRKCWGTAKERERNRARYLIRQRVVVHADGADPNQPFQQRVEDSHHEERIPHFIQHVIQGDKSAFSVCAMEENVHLFQSAHSISRWLDWEAGNQRLTTIVLSKFGPLYCQELKEYCSDDLVTFTFIEFASWLGQYAMVASLIKGGISPTVKSHYRIDDEEAGSDMAKWQQRAQDVGASIMERFFENFPVALSTYIVKRVIEMRWQAWKSWKCCQENNEIWRCSSCQTATPQSYRLCFGLPCMHDYCEVCFWKHILVTVDQRGFQDDVVLCPICGSSSSPQLPVATFHDDESPSSRRQSSLAKFQSLPANARELRSRPKQEKQKKAILATSWAEAVMTSVGNSKDIRLEKFLSYAERRNTCHYVHGCLVAGVDVNAQNEYGQTALYLAAWRGNVPLVQLLLEYGADPTVAATGGMSTVQSICVTCGHDDIIEILLRFQDAAVGESIEGNRNLELHPLAQQFEALNDPQPLFTNILIPTSSEHPGAGSYVVDHAVPADVMDQIVELWRRLPVDDATTAEKKFKKKNKCCSNRTYYCDAEGWLSAILMQSLMRASLIHPDTTTNTTEVIFPHMRFLHYEHAGTDLAPHVDLSRVSPLSGLRSTHTFILYLSNCRQGGETVLLQELSGKNKIEIATVVPARGRLLLFPHSCPHKGNAVVDVPKLLVRGEIRLIPF